MIPYEPLLASPMIGLARYLTAPIACGAAAPGKTANHQGSVPDKGVWSTNLSNNEQPDCSPNPWMFLHASGIWDNLKVRVT
ncbi:hypothetical protein AB3X96_33685 [Paraburkholderia sp. BR13439]